MPLSLDRGERRSFFQHRASSQTPFSLPVCCIKARHVDGKPHHIQLLVYRTTSTVFSSQWKFDSDPHNSKEQTVPSSKNQHVEEYLIVVHR